MAARKQPPTRMTVAEFLAWDPGDPSGRAWQLVDGEPVAMAPASETHAALQAEISRLLGNHLIEQRSPCRVLTEPGIVPMVHANRNYRVPDIGVTCAEPSNHLMVPESVLLIELMSPSNETEAWANILTSATLPNVPEIVAVHTTRIGAELLRRRPDNLWPEEPEMIAADGTLILESVWLAVLLAALYRTTVIAGR